MGNKREFEIAFVGLKPGIHIYDYEITDNFFENYDVQDFTNCNAKVKLSLDKNNGFMQLHFDIEGTVNVDCDRCGNPLTKTLWDEFNIIVKLVDEAEAMNEQEEDPDIFYINKGESHLTINEWIFEFVNLSVPLQKICGEKEDGTSLCNPEVIEKLKSMEANIEKVNPLWKGLTNIEIESLNN